MQTLRTYTVYYSEGGSIRVQGIDVADAREHAKCLCPEGARFGRITLAMADEPAPEARPRERPRNRSNEDGQG